ncbi:hypothetical protein [Streptomyces sp. NPDC005498]|uniref:hypothetical protein n=1 Tax=Streptomyces sp. NPDC005498 TaxID=3364717 RepID=UPI0036ABF9F6
MSTPSMELWASNMESLIPHLDNAYTILGTVRTAAGGLPNGRALRTKIGDGNLTNDTEGVAGMVRAYQSSMQDISDGIKALADGARKMAKKYVHIEDANGMSVTDLQQYLQEAQGDFDRLKQHLVPSSSTSGGGSGGGSSGGGTGGK